MSGLTKSATARGTNFLACGCAASVVSLNDLWRHRFFWRGLRPLPSEKLAPGLEVGASPAQSTIRLGLLYFFRRLALDFPAIAAELCELALTHPGTVVASRCFDLLETLRRQAPELTISFCRRFLESGNDALVLIVAQTYSWNGWPQTPTPEEQQIQAHETSRRLHLQSQPTALRMVLKAASKRVEGDGPIRTFSATIHSLSSSAERRKNIQNFGDAPNQSGYLRRCQRASRHERGAKLAVQQRQIVPACRRKRAGTERAVFETFDVNLAAVRLDDLLHRQKSKTSALDLRVVFQAPKRPEQATSESAAVATTSGKREKRASKTGSGTGKRSANIPTVPAVTLA